MGGLNGRHTYQATFNHGSMMDGRVECPNCKETTLHPTGHTIALPEDVEYAPVVGVVAWCECGQAVDIRLGNYKGHLGIDVVPIGSVTSHP